jgi:hypothetical protein
MLYADVVFNDFGKESQYSNQQDFTMRKAKYTMCLEKLQALRPGAKRANKIVRRRRSGC